MSPYKVRLASEVSRFAAQLLLNTSHRTNTKSGILESPWMLGTHFFLNKDSDDSIMAICTAAQPETPKICSEGYLNPPKHGFQDTLKKGLIR